jgi:hypothetical protein
MSSILEVMISNERTKTCECNHILNKGEKLGKSCKTSHKSGPAEKSLCDFQNNKIDRNLMNTLYIIVKMCREYVIE